MASLSKLLREALGIDTAGDFPYTFPIVWDESLYKSIYKSEQESITLTDLFSSISTLLQVAVFSIDDYYTGVWSIDRLQYESLSITEYLSKSLALGTIYETLDIFDLLSTVWGQLSVYLEQFTLNEYYDRVWSVKTTYYELISIVDYITSRISVWVDIGIETLNMSDYRIHVWTATKALTDVVTLVDYFSRISEWYYVLYDSITLLDFVGTIYGKIFSVLQTLDITSYLSYVSDWETYLTDTTVLSDLYERVWDTHSTLADSITLLHTIIFTRGRRPQIFQSITLIDTIDWTWASIAGLLQEVTLSDFIESTWSAYLNILQSMNIADYMLQIGGVWKSLYQSISLNDFVSTAWDTYLTLLYQISILDYVLIPLMLSQTLTELVLLIDSIGISRRRVENYLDSLTLNNFYDRIWATSLDWPKTVEGLIISPGYFAYSWSMIRPLVDYLYLFDTNTWITAWGRPLFEALTLIDYWVTGAMAIAMQLSLSLADYPFNISQFYRVLDDTLSITAAEDILWTILRDIAESLSIPDTYHDAWTVIRQAVDNIGLDNYQYWITTWTRLPHESYDIGEYLYKLYRFDTKLLFNIEDYGTTIAELYRSQLETLTMPSILEYVGTFLRGQVMSLTLTDSIDYLLPWITQLTETILLFGDIDRVSTFTRLYTENLDITSFLDYISNTVRSFSETMDIVTDLDYIIDWSSIIFIEIMNIFHDYTMDITWVRDNLESVLLLDYMSKYYQFTVDTNLPLLDLLGTVSSYPRDFIENLALQDYFIYAWISFGLIITEILDLIDYTRTATDFVRVMYEFTDISSFLYNVVAYARLPRVSITLTPFVPVFNIYKHITYSIQLIDQVLSGYQLPLLQQLQYLDFYNILYSIDASNTLQIKDSYDRLWQAHLITVQTMDITSILTRSVVDLYEYTSLYLKKVTADLTARFSRMIRV